ncbi:MAG: M3 family oligoendopeptidase [Myxococcota bacterium]|nr:M3 family oligoendopeptidase [Myxococcota bacterium]
MPGETQPGELAEKLAEQLPNWDMTPYFAEPNGADYRAFRERLAADVAALAGELECLGEIGSDTGDAWVALLVRLEDAVARQRHLGSYLACLGAADARDEEVQRETASLAAARAELEKVFVALRAAFRAAPDAAFDALLADARLRDVAWFLRRVRERAAWSMDAPLEGLAADLDVTGLSAWGRLYDQVSGTLEFDLEVPGRPAERLPVSRARSLLGDADPAVRRAALRGANRAWEGVGEVTAASLNAIAGTRLTLNARRGVKHFLDPALFDASISRRTLETLLDVVSARQEVARRFLREKARRLGVERLGFQDLEAPAPGEPPARVGWDEAQRRIGEAFERFDPALGAFAAKCFDERWIDWEPRPGKRPGGFCSSSSVIGQSRVFITYDGALGDVSTLAHELGHAWHAWQMRDMRPWARSYPMTLAETASTFAEQLVTDAALSDPAAGAAERAAVLDGRLSDASAFLLNIPMRFRFERAVYEERARGELSVSRLKELMCDAQRACYGDSLAEDELDPWFWASKLHFYITGLSFYNFPYTFGYLFSLGLFARAREEGRDFLPRYAELLRLTGSDSAEGVARRALGVELEEPAFWNASIDLVERDLERYLETPAA